MILTSNTIFITGGGSGIGRGLAEALHKRGNLVIISGRRRSHLEATTKANPGMVSVELDLQDPKSIALAAKKLIAQYPKLNVLINNAGIMQIDDAAGVIDDALLVSTVNTNLLGSIRVTSALIEHLKKQPSATIIYNTSVLGYVPLAITACTHRRRLRCIPTFFPNATNSRTRQSAYLRSLPRGCRPTCWAATDAQEVWWSGRSLSAITRVRTKACSSPSSTIRCCSHSPERRLLFDSGLKRGMVT
jgi:NAD(P)-dependent dehydrogenase (short-subunit alcohol dehydrogenase family)